MKTKPAGQPSNASQPSCTLAHPFPASAKLRFPGLPCLLLLLLTLSAATWNGLAACDGFGGSGNDPCGANIPPNGVLVIPATFPDGQPVTKIASHAFDRNYSLTSVIIPDSVTNIGDYAFNWCTGLTNVTMGNGVLRIGRSAFDSCYGVFRVTLPNSVTTVEDNAFFGCFSMTNATFGSGVSYIGNEAFSGCNLQSVRIPAGVTNIGVSAFFRCQVIALDPLNNSYSIVNGVLFDKGATTLMQCPYPKTGSYTVPSSVTNITARAFEGSQLTGITLPAGLTVLGSNVFAGSRLTSIAIPNIVSRIPEGAFYGGSLMRATIGSGVETIETHAFASCPNLTNIVFGPNVRDIRYEGFRSCSRLPSLLLPNSLTNMGPYSFADCTTLANVTIPNGVTAVEEGAFGQCFALTNVSLPPSLEDLGNFAFGGCWSLANVTIADGLRRIGNLAFNSCALKAVTLPSSVTDIGVQAFFRCSSLTNITFGAGVVRIGDYAFFDSLLTSVMLPASVAEIGDRAFFYCPLLSAITVDPLNNRYRSVDGVLFDKSIRTLIQFPNGKAGSYVIPNTVTVIGASSFESTSLLTDVTIPPSVTRVQANAFRNCSALYGLHFLGDAPVADALDGSNSTVFYLPGTSGWAASFGGRPTALWFLPNPLILTPSPSFGVRTNAFGFRISWATNVPVVVEACANLAAPDWSPVSTNTLSDGWTYFSDPEWTNHPARMYRVRKL